MRLRIAAIVPLLALAAPLTQQADAVTAAAPTRAAAPTATASTRLSMAGVDVSKYQHADGRPINWPAMRRSGIDFAFIKATGGTNRVDPWFNTEWAAARKAGMIRGAYHYADPSHSARAQAALVVRTVGSTREANNLGIVLDLEDSGGLGPAALARWAHVFLTTVEQATGRVPIIYTAPYFWHGQMRDNRTFGRYPLWLAHYTSKRPAALPGWKRWTFWQFTSNGRAVGVRGAVDRNWMCCSSSTLRALADGRSLKITRLWSALGGASGRLGLPMGPEVRVPGGWAQTFEHGAVVSSARGTFALTGSVLAAYRARGGAGGALGVPVAAEHVLADGVTEQRFARGRIVSAKGSGAHALLGAFEARWLQDGGVAASYGLPIADATAESQQFVGGGLYATPTGVHLVPGAMRDTYEDLGGPSGSLGLPLGEARPVLGGLTMDFELGPLYEIEVAGQKVVL